MTAGEHMREAVRQLALCRPLLTDEKVIIMVLDAMTILGCAIYLVAPAASKRVDGPAKLNGSETGSPPSPLTPLPRGEGNSKGGAS